MAESEIIRTLAERVKMHGETLDRVSQAIERLVSLEVKHAETNRAIERAFGAITGLQESFEKYKDDQIERLQTLEQKIPTLLLAQKMVFGMTGLITVSVIGALIALVVK